MNYKILLKWFGIIGSIASIASVIYIFLPSNDNIKLVVNTSNVERLTQTLGDGEPNFKVDYKYKGKEIRNLWKYNIQFRNTSNKTLIGGGSQKNILEKDLTFILKNEYLILDYKRTHSDFNNNIIIDSTKLKISFDQWRTNEILEYSFYVKTNTSEIDTLLLSQPKSRQIIDGDIIFAYQDLINNDKKITYFIPNKLKSISYIIVLIILILFFASIVLLTVIGLQEYIKIIKWKKNNFSDYKESVRKKFSNQGTIKKYIRNPKLNKENSFWMNFKGAKYPDVESFNLRKFYHLLLFLVLALIILNSIIITAIELIYLL